MKEIFNKQVNAFLALLIFQILIIFVVVVETFQDLGGPIHSFYKLISKSPGLLGIFHFNLRKYQRDRAIIRLHNWARNGVVVLAQYRQENADTADSQEENFDGVKAILDKMNANLRLVIADARILGGELNEKIKKAIGVLQVMEVKLVNNDKSLFADLQDLQHDLADIMIRAFEFFR
jgi:hypothetical protein